MTLRQEVTTHERLLLAAMLRDAEKRLQTAQAKVSTGHGAALQFALLRVREALDAAIQHTEKIR